MTLIDVVCEALPSPPARRPWRDERVGQVIAAIVADYTKFKLRQFATTAGMSPYRLSAVFRERVGLPLGTFLRRVRVHAARYLIEQEDLKVEAAARSVGFHDASHLSNAFHALMGYRPGQNRRTRSR
jgi:transcriptional regulator GlxA family with amidase domain